MTQNNNPIEQKMQEDYNMISKAFAASKRVIKWSELRPQLEPLPHKALILDIGCGAGRTGKAIIEDGFDYMGIDISPKQIKIACNVCPKGQFIVGSMLDLPFEDNQFDAVVIVATFHHLHTKAQRLQALAEAKRVLKKDGLVLITVMNFWRPKFWKLIFSKEGKDKVPEDLVKNLKWNDLIWPWKWKTDQPVYRYYHAFRKSELAKYVRQSGLKIKTIRYEAYGKGSPVTKSKNLVVVAKK